MRLVFFASVFLAVSVQAQPTANRDPGLDRRAQVALAVGAAPLGAVLVLQRLDGALLAPASLGVVLVGPSVGWAVAGHPLRALPGLATRVGVAGGTVALAVGVLNRTDSPGELFVTGPGAVLVLVAGAVAMTGVAVVDTLAFYRTLGHDSARRAQRAVRLAVAL